MEPTILLPLTLIQYKCGGTKRLNIVCDNSLF